MNRNIILIFMIPILLFTTTGVWSGDPDPPDPPPPPPPCCPPGRTNRVAVHCFTNHEKVDVCVGERGDVFIFQGNTNVTGQTIQVSYPYCGDVFRATGGGDDDVCVNPDNPLDFNTFPAPVRIDWSGADAYGKKDPTDSWKFIISPERDEKYIPFNTSITLTATF